MQTSSFGKALVSLLALVLCSVFVAASALVASSASSGASAARRKGFLNFSQGQRGLAFAASHSCVHHRKSDSLLFVSSGQGAHSPRGFGGWGADAALGCTDTAGPWRRRSFVCVRRAAVKCTATFISCGGIGVGEDDRQTQQCQSPLSPGSGDRNAAERERETRERERDAREERKRTPFVLDGSAFHGASAFATAPLGFQTRMVPYDRSLALPVKEAEVTPDPQASQLPPHPLDLILRETKNDAAEEAGMKDASKKETALRSLDASVFDGVNFDSFFGPGVRYQRVREGYLAFPPTVPDQTFLLKVEHGGGDPSKPKFVSSHAQTPSVTALRNADSPVMPPSFLNPKSRFLQTGAAAEERRRNDSGAAQKKRWGMEAVENDIKRGRPAEPEDRFKEMLDSIDWEREYPTHQDTNYYKRNTIETQLGDPDRTHSSYFDPQYIGAIDAFPYADFTHKTYTWRLHWIPYLALTYFKGDAPIRSPIFSLAGVDPLQVGKVCSRSTSGAFWVFVAKKNFVGCEKGVCAQLWFYPAGSGDAPPGFCSVKLVSRPGWHLPFKIKVWARGASAISSQQREALLKAVRKLAPSREGGSEAGDGRASEEHNPRTLALAAVEAAAEPSQVCVGPCWREEANYVAGTTAFCRLLNKGSFTLGEPFQSTGVMEQKDVQQAFPSNSTLVYDPETDVVLDAFGGVHVGVSVCGGGPSGEDEVESDFGAWEFEQWLKRQSAFPDDPELERVLPAEFTHSPHYESFRYTDIPDKHFSRYLPQSRPPDRTANVACSNLQPTA